MFKYSQHQDKILAAIQNPINSELVQQLSQYVDFSSIPKLNDLPETKKSEELSHKTPETVSDNRHVVFNPKPVRFAPKNLVEDNSKAENTSKEEQSKNDEETNSKEIQENPSEDLKEDSVNSSSNIVLGQTVLYPNTCVCMNKLPEVVNQIKSTLNLNSNTSGVNRVLVKDKELWIYYNDSINLNNVMGAVIELLNAANYNYLNFNRLARSDNAIVFEISVNDTDDKVDPIGDYDEKEE